MGLGLNPNGTKTLKTYDKVGRLDKVLHMNPGGTALWSETSRYDQRDRRTARIHHDGKADLFTYDPAGQVTAAAYGQSALILPQDLKADTAQPPAVTRWDQTFAYDPAGQVVAAAYGQASTVAITAPRDEPKSPDSPDTPNSPKSEKDSFTPTQTFAYDAAGNRMKTTDQGQSTEYKANENNQYTSIAENGQQHEPDYDKSGNLLHDATRKFTWDADIHLLSVTTNNQAEETVKPGTKNEEPRTESFRYDPFHRRISRTESSSQTTTYFIHDGWNVIAEYSAPQNHESKIVNHKSPSARHVWGDDLSRTLQGTGGIGGLLSSTHNITSIQNERSETKNLSLFFSYDSNGNVILLTDAQSATAAKYRYDAFGQTIAATGPDANLNRYRFSTKPVEPASGLAFFGHRYYDPKTGRWPSRDPIAELGGVNIYVMVSNNPMTGQDILGFGRGCAVRCGDTYISTNTSQRCCDDKTVYADNGTNAKCCKGDGTGALGDMSARYVAHYDGNYDNCINACMGWDDYLGSTGLAMLPGYWRLLGLVPFANCIHNCDELVCSS